MAELSVVILTNNEENNIVDCLESLSWCDDVVVIDDNSQDMTVELAKKNGATVITNSLSDNFSSQRNFGLKQAKYEWVLFVDADERVTDELKKEIQYRISQKNQEVAGYFIKRCDILWGKKLQYGETSNILLLRLAKKDVGLWLGAVHETWQVKGQKGVLESELFHYPHPTIGEFISEVNRYSDIRAKELFSQEVTTSWIKILLYTKGKFFYDYILLQGFRDGIEGILVAVSMAFHSFLVRSKLWFLWKKNEI